MGTEFEGFSRVTRGAVRLDLPDVDAMAIRDKLTSMDTSDWASLGYGEEWTQVQLLKPDGRGGLDRHGLMDELDGLSDIISAIPGECLDLTIARLGPGGWVKEHRDLSGGTPMGVARFHFPLITNEDVAFHVSGERVVMRQGEVWNLDTSYRHRVANGGDAERIHLIADYRMNDEIKEMLPPTDARDLAHRAYFFAVCVVRGVQKMVTNPRQGVRRLRQFVNLKILKRSQLVFDE